MSGRKGSVFEVGIIRSMTAGDHKERVPNQPRVARTKQTVPEVGLVWERSRKANSGTESDSLMTSERLLPLV